MKKTSITVKRHHAEKATPFEQTYQLESDRETTVLDALNLIKDKQDSTLTFRWSCRMGICGSCSAVVNGKPVLMCQTNLSELKNPIIVEPLRNFPVIRDLVCDIGDAFEKMRSVNPWISQAQRKAIEDGEYKQTPQQRKKIEQTSQCIKCMLCYSACPVYGLNKKFIGPAAGALAYRYAKDSRNENPALQINAATSENGAYECSFVGECSVVCPKRVDPAVALQRLKLMGVLHPFSSR